MGRSASRRTTTTTGIRIRRGGRIIEDPEHMVANDGVGMVIVDGMEELDSTNIDVHENDKNIEEHDEDFVLLDWENGEEKEANKKFVY